MKSILFFIFVVLTIGCNSSKDSDKKDSSGNPFTPTPDNSIASNANQWFAGESGPTADLGRDGDFYLSQQGDIYYKNSGAWVRHANIKGPAGGQGQPGPAGQPGAPGPAGENGADGLNANALILAAEIKKNKSYMVTRPMKIKIPNDLDVTYGSAAKGCAVIKVGSRYLCSYRGQSDGYNPQISTPDYEKGKIYTLEKCVDAKEVTAIDADTDSPAYQNAPAIDLSTEVSILPNETLTLEIISAGTRMPKVKVQAIFEIKL